MICISNIINDADLESINALIDSENDTNGDLTAGHYAQTLKYNKQQFSGDAVNYADMIVKKAFQENALVQNFCFPKAITPLRIVRYMSGMYYGRHTDNVMQKNIRTDISFTIFLSDPETYQGGELKIYNDANCQSVKLAAGSVVFYPSDTIHEVTPVKSGERVVIVGWIESHICDEKMRSILSNMAHIQDYLINTAPKTEICERAIHSFNQLFRLNCT